MNTSRPLRALPLLLALSAPLTSATPAHAGPTASADLDLGTSTRPTSPGGPSPLYTVGITLRAGWRLALDRVPVWFLPEIGASYAVDRIRSGVGSTVGSTTSPLGRIFGGGRVGWTYGLRPELRFEPSIFGHAGAGWPVAGLIGSAFDVGLSLDLRIREHFIVGAQVGYDVVTVYPPSTTYPPTTVIIAGTPVTLPGGTTGPFPPIADPWVSYGVHAGWLFW